MKKKSLFIGIACLIVLLIGGNSLVLADMPRVVWRIQTHTTMGPPDLLKKYSKYLKQTPESLPVWSFADDTIELARRVKERTNGKFILKLYTAGELFKAKEMYAACEKGAIEMLAGYGAYFAGRNPAGFISNNIPYGTSNLEEGYKLVFETDFVKVLRRAYTRNNLYFLFPAEAGTDGISTKFSVKTIEDMKGKKIRGPGVKGKVCEALGAIGLSIATAEQYTALQRGTIDGVFFPYHVNVSYRLVEQLNYAIWPAILNPTFAEWVVNMDAWKKLPKEYQNILAEEAESTTRWRLTKLAPWQVEWTKKQNEKFGVENINLSIEEWNRFKRACLPIWDELAAKSPENAELIGIYKGLAALK